MDSFEFNKIAASVLLALLIAMAGNLLGEALIHPHPLEKPAYVIEGVVAEDVADHAIEEEAHPIQPLLASANPENGKSIAAKKCATCHTFDKGGANKVGPNLWNVVMNHLTHVAGFAFSSAMKEKYEKEKSTWDAENLNKFIYKPNKFIKGTKMAFVGIKDDKERADVIAYLATINDSPVKFE